MIFVAGFVRLLKTRRDMPSFSQSISMRYGVAAASVAAAVAARLLLDPLLGDLFPFATVFFAVLVAAWYGGFGPALAATLLGAVASAWLLLPPRGSFAVHGFENQAGLIFYVGVSLGIALLGGAMRAARQRGQAAAVTFLNPAAETLTGWTRQQAEEALRQSEDRFARFMQHLPGLAWLKDVQGRYVYANEAAMRVFRRRREELYGRSDEEVFPPETVAQFKENDRQALASGTGVQVVEALKHEDGVIHYSIVSKFPIPGQDGRTALLGGMAIDVTERKRAEQDARFLSDASAALAGLVDYESTLQKVARLAVPTFADWCTVDMLDEGGRAAAAGRRARGPLQSRTRPRTASPLPARPRRPAGRLEHHRHRQIADHARDHGRTPDD